MTIVTSKTRISKKLSPDFCKRVSEAGAVGSKHKLPKVHGATFVIVKHPAHNDNDMDKGDIGNAGHWHVDVDC